jgi:hypothetical protein
LQGWIELIAFAVSGYHTGVGKLSQAGANRGGAQAAEFTQLLHADRLIQASQDLLDALESAWFRSGLSTGGIASNSER